MSSNQSEFSPPIATRRALIERCTETLQVDAGHDYRLRQLEKAPLYLDAADPFVDDPESFRGPGETYGRPPTTGAPDRADALVFDGTSLTSLRAVFDFFDGGAEDEVTLRANRAAVSAERT